MCEFMSAWVGRYGKVFFDENLDSHEDLADLFNLHADNGLRAVRVEYVPDLTDLDKPFMFRVDEETTPEWFDTAMQEKTKEFLLQPIGKTQNKEIFIQV